MSDRSRAAAYGAIGRGLRDVTSIIGSGISKYQERKRQQPIFDLEKKKLETDVASKEYGLEQTKAKDEAQKQAKEQARKEQEMLAKLQQELSGFDGTDEEKLQIIKKVAAENPEVGNKIMEKADKEGQRILSEQKNKEPVLPEKTVYGITPEGTAGDVTLPGTSLSGGLGGRPTSEPEQTTSSIDKPQQPQEDGQSYERKALGLIREKYPQLETSGNEGIKNLMDRIYKEIEREDTEKAAQKKTEDGNKFKTSERKAAEEAELKKLAAKYGYDVKLQKLKETNKPSTKVGSETFKQESNLRKEYNALSKDYSTIRDSYSRVQVSAQEPSAAGDLSMVFNYMKMLDPGSVVRESEYASAENARGVPETIRNMYNKVIDGEILSQKQRKDFLNRANQLYETAERGQLKQLEQYRKNATSYGIDPDRVTGSIVVDVESQNEEEKPGSLSDEEWQELQELEKRFGK